MIFDSGHIQIAFTSGGGIRDGKPVKASKSYGAKIACHIVQNLYDHKGSYEDGKFKRMQYTIYFPMQPFEAKRVLLTDSENKEIGEFEIQSIQFLHLVQRVKITV